MIQKYFRPVLIAGLSMAVLLSTELSAQQDTEVGSRYNNWLDYSGLGQIFRFVEQDLSADNHYRIRLEAGNWESPMLRERRDNLLQRVQDIISPPSYPTATDEIYRDLFFKLLSLTTLPPDHIKLEVIVYRGYCDGPEFLISIGIRDQELFLDEELLHPGGMILCSLDFSAIERYEEMITTVLDEAYDNSISSVVEPIDSSVQLAENYLTDRYNREPVQITLTQDEEYYFELVVRNLKEEVIPRENFWEKLRIKFLVLDYKEQRITHLSLDGQYGSGIRPPSNSGYRDMEPRFTGDLKEYGENLLVEIRREVRR